MKKIIEILLKYGITPIISYFSSSCNKDDMFTIETADQLAVLKEEVHGVLVECGPGDLIALEFTGVVAQFLESFLVKLGCSADYKWVVTDGSRHFIYLRVNYLMNQFGKKEGIIKLNPKQTGTFEAVAVRHRANAPFAPLYKQGKNYEFVNGEIGEDTPPFDVHIDKLIEVLSEYTDVADHRVKFEQEVMKEKAVVEEKEEHVETSMLPHRIYGKLPQTIKNYVGLFDLPREKDISLLAVLVVISCCIPNVVSRHMKNKIWANLYLAITAGAASGKGVLAYAIRVVGKIETLFREKYEAEMKVYLTELKRYKNGETDDEPIEPVRKTIQLATDNSFAALFKQLVNNYENGLLFETEIDVFVRAGKAEWSDYSLLNRKATHHEPHTVDRKNLKAPLHAKSPRLGICMAGTPNQFFNLFKSIEDGLYSRFLIYCYQLKEIIIVNPFDNEGSDQFDKAIEDTTNFVFDLYQSLIALDHEINFQWTLEQGKTMTRHFISMKDISSPIYGTDIASIVKRYMLDASRIAMVLTTVEAFEAGTLMDSKTLTPGDHIMDVVLGILDTCSEHSFLMMTNIRANAKSKPLDMKSMKMLKFFDVLPIGKSFKTKEAIVWASKLGISARSVGDYLPSLCKSAHLEQVSTGLYRRTK